MTEPRRSLTLRARDRLRSPTREGSRWFDRLFPGDRRVWRWSLLIFIPALALIGGELLVPRTYYTGTDSVAPTILLPPLTAGQQLCTQGVPLGPNTASVDFSYGWPDGGPAKAVLTVSTGGRVIARGTSSSHPAPAPEETSIPLTPAIPAGAQGRVATICLRNAGSHEIQLAGFPTAFPDLKTTIDDKTTAESVAIWLSPPAGQRRSLVDNWAAIMRRLTVFRPGFAGVVFYWLALTAGLPLLAYLGIRLLAQATLLSPRRLALWVALLAFVGAAAWALTTYAFDAPDEPSHFAYTELLAQTGHAPSSPTGPAYSDALTDALGAVRQFTLTGQLDARRPWTGAEVDAYQRTVAREHPDEDNGDGLATATAPHSPLYYALLIPGYELGHSNIFTELFWMRLTSALLGALISVCVLLTLRELVPSRPEWAVAGALLVAFEPMVSFMSGAVNNDNGVNALAALSVYLTVRLMRRGLTPGTAAALGITLGLLPLMKATGFALFPAVMLVLVVLMLRRRSLAALGSVALTALGFCVIFGIWALLAHHFHRSVIPVPNNVIPSATVVAAGSQASTGSASPLNGLGGRIVTFLEVFFPDLPGATRHFAPGIWPLTYIYIKRGIADFGWGGVYFPGWIYKIIYAVMAAAGALGLWTVVRRFDAVRHRWLEAVFLIVVILSVIFVVEYSYYNPTPRPPAVMPEQGRYIFTALVPLAALSIVGTLSVRRSLASVGLTVMVGAMITFAIASHLLYLTANFT